MIRHIVMFSAAAPEHVETILTTLRGYAEIPFVASLSVERNARLDAVSDEIDIVLHAEFTDRAALEAYKRHPIYEAGTRTIRPIRNLRFVADCEIAA